MKTQQQPKDLPKDEYRTTLSEEKKSVERVFEWIKHGTFDVTLATDPDIVSPSIQRTIKKGRYEREEGTRLSQILMKDDRVLELGAGLGFISTLAFKTGLTEAICSVEADPRLIPLIKATHHENGVNSVKLLHGVILRNAKEGATETFYVRQNFWGNSLIEEKGRPVIAEHAVPTYDFGEIVETFKPTIIVADIEGGEAALFKNLHLPTVRQIMMEVHQDVIGREGMRTLFMEIHEAGFHYDEHHSSGGVIVFSKTDI